MTLNGNGLARRYDRLTPGERFRAALEASARGDFEERDRLLASCPQRDYPLVMGRLDASRDLALIVGLELGPRLAQARMLDATAELAARSVVLGAHAVNVAAVSDVDRLDDAELAAAVEEPYHRMIGAASALVRSDAAAVYEAFAGVCRDRMAVEPETVLHAHLGPVYVEQFGLAALEGAERDEDATSQWRELFERRVNDADTA